jgi:hypothetical protein
VVDKQRFIAAIQVLSYPVALKLFVMVDRNYIFNLYWTEAGAGFCYPQQIEQRVEDAKVSIARAQQAKVGRYLYCFEQR